MSRPDADNHDPSPAYLRSLIEAAGLSQRQAAHRIGISERQMRYYLAEPGQTARHAEAPYPVQYALEALAGRFRTFY